MLVQLFVPMAVFAMATAVVALVTGIIGTGMLHSTIREALRSHPESVPPLLAALRGRAPWADALLGWIALAFGATIVLLSLFEDPETRMEYLKASVLPFVIGIVVLVYLRVARPATLPPA